MSLNSSSVLTLLAPTDPLQAAELPAQGNLGIKSTRCSLQRFSWAGFSWGALLWRGESANIHTSCTGAWATPSAHTHLHQPHLGQKRRFALCGLSLPSPLFLLPSHTTPEGCRLLDRSVTCGSAPARRILCPSNPTQRGHLSQPVSPPSIHVCDLLELQPGSGCASTRSTLDPSFWQYHQLRSNYSSHELDPVPPLKLPQLTAEVQTVTQ